jgi:hypothetical protein
MRMRGAQRFARALCGLMLAGLVAGCGVSAGPKPNANAPSQNQKAGGPAQPNKSGIYNAGRPAAKKTGNSAGNAARYGANGGSNGTHGNKAGGTIYRNLSGSARKTANKTGSSVRKATNKTGSAARKTANKTGSSVKKAGSSARIGTPARTRGTVKKGSTGASRRKTRKGTGGAAGAARRRRGSWIFSSSSITPMSLTTLPPLTYVQKLNPWLKHAHQISSFIPNMGYHWATPYPGIVLMTNQAGAVTAVEAAFPQKLGQYSWWDPVTTEPNGGVAFNSEHLYFVAPSSITPTMTTTSSDLTSWSTFESINTRLAAYVKEPSPFLGLTVYGPPTGPGIKVLVNAAGTVSGFVVEEPATNGHFPGYYPMRRHPLASKEYGKAYDSVLLLTPLSKKGT